jgi:tetratricopeptide (TPR) repeat protein
VNRNRAVALAACLCFGALPPAFGQDNGGHPARVFPKRPAEPPPAPVPWNCDPAEDHLQRFEKRPPPVPPEQRAAELACVVKWLAGPRAGDVGFELYEQRRQRAKYLVQELSGWLDGFTPDIGDDRRAAAEHYRSGMLKFQAQQYDAVRPEWEAARKLDPWNPDAPKGLSMLDRLTEPSKPAEAAGPKGESQRLFLSGAVLFQQQKYAEARRQWKKALVLDPSNDDAKAGIRRIDEVLHAKPAASQ